MARLGAAWGALSNPLAREQNGSRSKWAALTVLGAVFIDPIPFTISDARIGALLIGLYR